MKDQFTTCSLPILSSVGLLITLPLFFSSLAEAQAPPTDPLPIFNDYITARSGAKYGTRKNIGGRITTGIETSYKKVEYGSNAPKNPLPDYYYLRLENGEVILLNGEALLDIGENRPVRWADTVNHIYSIQCLRNVDESLEVHSSVNWFPTSVSSGVNNGFWMASPTFTASVNGFSDPRYKWNWSGGYYDGFPPPPTGVYVDNTWISFPQRYPLEFGITGLKLSSDFKSSSLPETKVDVKVIDNIPSASSTEFANSYNVVWHRPAENYTHLTQLDTVLLPDTIPLEKVGNSDYIEANLKYIDTSQNHEFDLGTAVGLAGNIVGGIEGAYILIAGVTAPISEIWVAAGILASSALQASSILIGSPPEQTPDQIPDKYTEYQAYLDALNEQDTIGDYSDGQVRFTPEEYINDAKLAIKSSFHDDEFARTYVRVSGKVIIEKTKEAWEYEKWDEHGYVGQKIGHFTRTKAPKPQITFSSEGYTPEPNPTPTEPPLGG